MAKLKLNEMTQEQLESYEKQLEQEIDSLTKVVEASNTTVFDILINEVKEEMKNNIAEEEWKVLKENQKKIESYRSIEKALQNQEDLLEKKEEELANVQDALKNYQTHLFDNQPAEEAEAVETGYVFDMGDDTLHDVKTGDVFKFKEPKDEVANYYLVKRSVEIADSFAFISNSFEGERCMQYPSNIKLINNAKLLGNIYDENADAEVLEALKIIADSQTAESQEG